MDTQIKKHKGARITILVSILVVVFIALGTVIGMCDLYGSSFLTSKFFKETKATNFAVQVDKCEKEKIVFFGDSITEMYDLQSHFKDATIYNRGISGDTTTGMLNRVKTNVIDLAPSKVFFLGGANDLNTGMSVSKIADNIFSILSKIKEALPSTQIIVQTVYPFNPTHKLYGMVNVVNNRKNYDVVLLNVKIKNICSTLYIQVVDTYSYLQKDAVLDKKFSLDGLHINEKGYDVVTTLLSPFVYDKPIIQIIFH